MKEDVSMKDCLILLKAWKEIKDKNNRWPFLTVDEIYNSATRNIPEDKRDLFTSKNKVKLCVIKLFNGGYLDKSPISKNNKEITYRPLKGSYLRQNKEEMFEKLFENRENEVFYDAELEMEMRLRHRMSRGSARDLRDEKLKDGFLSIYKGEGTKRQLYKRTYADGQHSKAALSLLIEKSKNHIILPRTPFIWFDILNVPPPKGGGVLIEVC